MYVNHGADDQDREDEGHGLPGRAMAELSRHLGVAKSTITRLKKKRDDVGELLAAGNRPGQGRKTMVRMIKR